MLIYARPVAKLIEELERLPGIGPKSAQRLAFYVLRSSGDYAERLALALREVKERIKDCGRCFNFSESDLCPVCSDPRRDASLLCVVSEPRDLMAIENSGNFHGMYHVLQGMLSPIDGIGPEQLRIGELLRRLKVEPVREVILATNPTVEGDATAMYLSHVIRPMEVRVTQLAMGLPVGGDLDYADQMTIARAVEGRREV